MAFESKLMYEWKPGYKHKVKPEVAGAVFEELERKEGLTAKNLVDASRPEDAPLHREFEWDDDIAAEKWREQQARVLIAHLTIRVADAEDAPPVRAYVSLSDATPNYDSMQVILKDAEKTDALFDKAMKELKAFEFKYKDIERFVSLFAEIHRLESEL